MREKNTFTINSLKYDGYLHRTWQAELLEATDNLLAFKGIFDAQINHAKLGVIRRGTVSHEFYWMNRHYNIFRFHESEGGLRNFYCNIALPPVVENNVLNYIDLDMDILVWKDFSVEILDTDEFELNAELFKYPSSLRKIVNDSLREILKLVKNKIFPFDFEINKSRKPCF